MARAGDDPGLDNDIPESSCGQNRARQPSWENLRLPGNVPSHIPEVAEYLVNSEQTDLPLFSSSFPLNSSFVDGK
jgi:hypothetical protein